MDLSWTEVQVILDMISAFPKVTSITWNASHKSYEDTEFQIGRYFEVHTDIVLGSVNDMSPDATALSELTAMVQREYGLEMQVRWELPDGNEGVLQESET